MDQFILLFPDKEHVYSDDYLRHARSSEELSLYFQNFNECIQKRYRNNNFRINHVLFRGEVLCSDIHKEDADSIIYANLSSEDAVKLSTEKKEYHIEAKHIISQLSDNIDRVVVGGYILNDCVERFAEDVFNLGIEDVLVDEDLTDLFSKSRKSRYFKTDNYPTIDLAAKYYLVDYYLNYRKNKPWLWQTFF